MKALGLTALGLASCVMLSACSEGTTQGDCRCGAGGVAGAKAAGGSIGSSPISTGGTSATSGGGHSDGGASSTGGVGTVGGSGGGVTVTGGDSGTGGTHVGDAGVDSGLLPALCELPFDVGPCDAAISVYWFNAQTGDCEMQSYGGCGGNDNRFATLEECRQTCGGSDPTACQVDADCGWGEIDHEILNASDCICLFGCPYLALNQSTISRRQQQYNSLCDPYTDGSGQPCPVDDCIQPPMLHCVGGQCTDDSTSN